MRSVKTVKTDVKNLYYCTIPGCEIRISFRSIFLFNFMPSSSVLLKCDGSKIVHKFQMRQSVKVPYH